MASLRDVRDTIFPTARPNGPLDPEVALREISWVRVMKARVPAFDALEPGDLAIVPSSSLAMVAPGAEGAAGLVEAFGRARVPALLLVEVETDDDALRCPRDGRRRRAGRRHLPDRAMPTRSSSSGA